MRILMCFDLYEAITSPDITLHTEVRDKNNITALHYVCENGNKELVQYLVEELKCDVGEFVGACLHMTACDNQGLSTGKQNNQSPQGGGVRWVGQWEGTATCYHVSC